MVIEKPNCCAECPRRDSLYKHCSLRQEEFLEGEYEKVQDWCPLKPMPNKYDWSHIDTTGVNPDSNDFDIGSIRGWNDCIDEILGEEE